MSEVEKKKRGRQSKYGVKNENKSVIAADLALIDEGNANQLTMYYIQKLIDMKLVKIELTGDGQVFLGNHK